MAGKKSGEEPESGVLLAPFEKVFDRLISPFEDFIHRQTTSGILLMLTTLLALVLANSAAAPFYHEIKAIPVSFGFGGWGIEKPLLLWVNDGLMAFFFFVVGLELQRELLFGELASPRKAALPMVAALGGMMVPALIYATFNAGTPTANGWAIPMATDIAFAIGVLVLLGSRVPRALMAMLVAIAIIDDLGAVITIAVFYTEQISMQALLVAGLLGLLLFAMNLAGIRKIIPYFCVAVLLWYVMLLSGIHPTLAGVIGAFSVPALPRYNPDYFSRKTRDLLQRFESSFHDNAVIVRNEEMKTIVHTLEKSVHNVTTPSQRLEHIWHLPVAYFVVPVFALFNAGISISPAQMAGAVTDSVFLGVFFGLLVGKFVGILGFTFVAVRSGLLELPMGIRFGHVAGMALVAGIGFTMSIFISSLAFKGDPGLLTMAKTGIFAASLFAGILGYLVLYRMGSKQQA